MVVNVSNNTYLGLSFYDIQKLDVDQNVKDELTLGFLHNLNLTSFITSDTVDFKLLRAIRLCLEHEVPLYLVEANLREDILTPLYELYSSHRTLNSSGLEPYFHNTTYELLVEPKTLGILVGLSLENVDFSKVDFTLIPLATIEVFASALAQGVDVSDLQSSRAVSDKDYLDFLISLRMAGVDIAPFLEGSWSEEQILAILRGRLKVSIVDFITHYINENFTAGQIEQCWRASDFGCLSLICSTDKDGHPIYNEYQMYQIVEGARFNLDYRLYADPSLNDSEMALQRTELFKKADENKRGALSSKIKSYKPKGAFW